LTHRRPATSNTKSSTHRIRSRRWSGVCVRIVSGSSKSGSKRGRSP